MPTLNFAEGVITAANATWTIQPNIDEWDMRTNEAVENLCNAVAGSTPEENPVTISSPAYLDWGTVRERELVSRYQGLRYDPVQVYIPYSSPHEPPAPTMDFIRLVTKILALAAVKRSTMIRLHPDFEGDFETRCSGELWNPDNFIHTYTYRRNGDFRHPITHCVYSVSVNDAGSPMYEWTGREQRAVQEYLSIQEFMDLH